MLHMSESADTEAALMRWQQGDVVDVGGFLKVDQDPETQKLRPVITNTRCVILTQTCDLVRSPDERPDVVLAPLVPISQAADLEAIKKGRYPRYAWVAGAGVDVVVDLDAAMTLTKDVLVRANRTRGLLNSHQARRFARSVGRKYQRAALPDDVVELLRPLEANVKRKHDREASPEGRLFNEQLDDIRVEIDPDDWSAPSLELTIVFILPAYQIACCDDPHPSAEAERWLETIDVSPAALARRLLDEHFEDETTLWLWQQLADAWVEKCDTSDHRVEAIHTEVITADGYGLNRVVASEQLDLDYLSVQGQPGNGVGMPH